MTNSKCIDSHSRYCITCSAVPALEYASWHNMPASLRALVQLAYRYF